MDLDDLKKDWQQTDVKVSIGEDKIKRMLGNKGQSAYEKLLKYEKLELALLIPALFVGTLFWLDSRCLSIFYSASVIAGGIWQWRKIKFLKKTDFLIMNILEVTERMNKYRTMLFSEIIVGIVWTFAFAGLICYISYHDRSWFVFWGGFVFISFFTFTTCFFIYKYLYYNNLKEIEQSIKEIEQFEKDNI